MNTPKDDFCACCGKEHSYMSGPCSNCKSNTFVATISDERRKSFQRSVNYKQLSGQDQWDEDKALGILDWDGS